MSLTEFGWPTWAGGAGGGWQGASFGSVSWVTLTPVGQVSRDVLWFLSAGGMIAGLHWRLHTEYPDAIMRIHDVIYEQLDQTNYSLRNFVIEDNMWVGPGVRFYVV